jgi:hypothetical protein
MKKSILLFCLLLQASTVIFAQANHLLWQANQISANAQANQVIAFAVDSIGNSFTINSTQDASSLFISNRFISYNANGVKKWEIQTDSCFTYCNEKYNCILPTGNGDVIFVGYKETVANVWQIVLKKYRSNGSLVWQRYNTVDAAKPIKAMFTSNQDIIVALDVDGITTGKDFGVAFYRKTNGSEFWRTIIPDAAINNDVYDDVITDMTIDAQDNIYCVGLTNSLTSGVRRMLISKWDVSGIIGYSNVIEPFVNVSDAKPKIIADNANHLYVTSNLYGTTLLKKFTDSNNSLLFSKTIKKDSTFTEFVDVQFINHKLFVLNNSHYLVPDGSFQGYYLTNNIYFVHATDSAGNTIWEKKYLTDFDKGPNKGNFGSASNMAKCTNRIL